MKREYFAINWARTALIIFMTLAIASIFSTSSIVLDTPLRSLRAVSLDFVEGKMVQEVIGIPPGISADWSAEMVLVRGAMEQIICPGGSGTAPYGADGPVAMAIDIWVGGDCEARLAEGETYRARASWEYQETDGSIVTVSRTADFTYQKGD